MLGLKDLTEDQKKGIDHIYNADSTLLVADMGAGKTVCALTAASELLQDGELKRILVVSTIKVAKNVWATEHKKWSHLEHLYIDLALGDNLNRHKAIFGDAEITCINFENLSWLCENFGEHLTDMFDGIIIDEVSKLKSNSGSNFKALRKHIGKFKWRLAMTGTPVSEDWTGLFGEMFMTDGGVALGKSKQKYLDQHFYPTDYERRNWKLIPGQDVEILNKIGDKLYHLPDYRHELPDLIEHDILIDADEHTRIMYANFKRDCIMQLNDTEIVAPNAAALVGKLQQICQGFTYSTNGTVNKMATHKLDYLMDMDCIKNKEPTVIVYWFKQDLAYLQDAFPEGVLLDGPDTIAQWNAGNISILFLQPRSAGHGLNLAIGGFNMIFYSMIWSNDLTKQSIARLWRRGQLHTVHVYNIMLKDTVDQLIGSRIASKTENHALLIKHLTK
jgi:SNF2 family DNA or RNA helicase